MPNKTATKTAGSGKKSRELTIVQALREAVREEMNRDENVYVMGEDIRIGGSFLFTLGLFDEYGPDRVINTPISETGFVGLAVGSAMQGMRPIVDFQYGDFILTAYDQIVQQATKLRYMSGGQVKIPAVFQLPSGASGRGAQHANILENYFFNVPGIKIVTPATPYDAKGLFKTAVRDNNVVLFFVHKHLYGSKGRNLIKSSVSLQEIPEEEYLIPFGEGIVRREGSDVTVVANSLMMHYALNAAEELKEEGIDVELVDPRTLVPFDKELVFESVKKTGRLVIVEEGNERGGWGAQISADVAAEQFESIKAPIKRVASPNVPIPFSPVLEKAVIPDVSRIKSAIKECMKGE